MDNRDEVRDFLTTRRARLTPETAGITGFGGRRRVPGLRREEVALLAGMSVEYYVRLERGNLAGVSESVLFSLARALRFDDVETAHLFDLARTANSAGLRPGPSVTARVRPGVRRLLDSMSGPAYVRNGRLDILATNALGAALYSPILHSAAGPANSARFTFLDAGSHDYWGDWNSIADGLVATLRSEAGRFPTDKRLTDLVGELATRSPEFRQRWATHDVYRHSTGEKVLHHPVVGELRLSFEVMTFPTDEGLVLLAYDAEPGSTSETALRLLASWASTTVDAD
ncbi:helix-turn-helix domain-containing protein [Microbacterium sp. CJ88]|uniref:helix-turn-helix domain-containing protein n=1 Tax=Microbacterium sp. CJ88 TaxID=3445672 RepID=UPI003F65EB3A